MRRIYILLATGFGVGYLPAPGSFGAVWGLLAVVGLYRLPPFLYAVAVAASCFLAIFVAQEAEKKLGHDSGKIVIDEVVGMMVACFFLPPTVFNLLLGFALFRILDITKPFPIRWIERSFAGGWGIVLDDLAAGLAANVGIRIISLFLR